MFPSSTGYGFPLARERQHQRRAFASGWRDGRCRAAHRKVRACSSVAILMHYFEQLFHASDGWVSATSENMSLHVDMVAGKTAPFPDDVARGLARMQAAHAKLPRPEAAGRRIAMSGKN